MGKKELIISFQELLQTTTEVSQSQYPRNKSTGHQLLIQETDSNVRNYSMGFSLLYY